MNTPSPTGTIQVEGILRLLLLFGTLLGQPFTATSAVLQVGVARVDITPSYPIRLNGFGGRRTESEGVSQRIWAKALAFDDPQTGPALIIAIDNLGVPEYIHQELSRRLARPLGIKPERMSLTATHTHTAPLLNKFTPTIFSVPIPPEHLAHVDRYTGELIDAMERVALSAWAARQPATLSHAVGQVTFAANRRTKGGPVDHDLPVLAIRGADGKLLAIYTSYACHCVTLSHNKISGDWAGYAQEAVEREFPGAVAVTSVGCGADSNPSSGVTGDRLDIAAGQGAQIATEITRLLKAPMKPVVGPLAAAMTRLVLSFDTLPTRAQLEEKAKRNDAVGYHARFNLAKLDKGETLPPDLPYSVQTWTFGNALAIVNLPGEVVVDYSLRLKREFDRTRLWVNGYANDAPCYIPSERVLKEGGYEGGDAMVYYDRPTRFAPGLEQKIIAAVHALLPADFQAPRGTDGTKPVAAIDALKTFRVHPGLELELVASEPLVTSPVAIDWSADGRLWVCEMYDYPQGLDNRFQPGGRIRVLQDTRHDGRYDRSEIFLNGIPFPTGIFAWGRGALVCAAPDILYAEDTDRDGRADHVVKLFSGFSTENYQARVNSLALGLDGWIYGANGLLGGEITNHLSGGTVDIRGRDFRFRLSPDLRQAQFETAAGLTQQGRVRDDWDQWFGCDNSTLVHHFPLPDHYVRRNPKVPGPSPAVYPPNEPESNRLYPISRALERFNDLDHLNHVTSACGIGIYRDEMLGADLKGDLFTCEPVHNLVHRLKLIPNGVTFTARKPTEEAGAEFLSSSDNWFRPVQVRTGPDGALWIVDIYRFLMEHPRWISPQRLASLDMRAGADLGRIYRLKRAGQPSRPIQDLTALTTEQLIAALDSPNGTERDRIQLAISHRTDAGRTPSLTALAAEASRPEVRAQALAANAQSSGPHLPALLRALQDPHPKVQALALTHSERWISGKVQPDSFSSGEAPWEKVWRAVVPLGTHTNLSLRYQLALSMGESSDARAGKLLAVLSRGAGEDAWLQAAIVTSAQKHAGAILEELLAQGDPNADPPAELQPLLQKLLMSANEPGSQKGPFAALLPRTKTGGLTGWRLRALSQLLNSEQPPGSDGQVEPSEWQARLADLLKTIPASALNPSLPEGDRSAAVGLLAWNPDSLGADLPVLASLAVKLDEPRIRAAALVRLSRLRASEVPSQLLKDWGKHSPLVRQDFLRLLLSREDWTDQLMRALKAGAVQPNELSLADRKRLTGSSSSVVREAAKGLFPDAEHSSREAVIRRYQSSTALVTGATPRGAELFAKNCSSCHQARGVGSRVGPDLDPLASRELDFWLKNILDPNAIVEPRFVAYEVETQDGRTFNGVVTAETATSLSVTQAGGTTEECLRSNIKSIRGLGMSLMPEGLEAALPVEDMAALLGYLRQPAPTKAVAGQSIRRIRSGEDGSLHLPATAAELRGSAITLERDFDNIGMWHGTSDQANWNIEVTRSGTYDVYLDYACAESSAGNRFQISLATEKLHQSVQATGSDWSGYVQKRVGSLRLSEGQHSLSILPEAELRGALMDLRAVALVPEGKVPRWPRSRSVSAPGNPPRDALSLARVILDPGSSDVEKEGATTTHPHLAAAILAELTRDLPTESGEEYRRIPWIWRLAILTARRNDEGQLRQMLHLSLPEENAPLRDWQAVVLGGGIINGLSQLDLWPAEKIRGLLTSEPPLRSRWQRALDLAARMADDPKVPTGTRYDALRLLGVESWGKRGSQILKYLPEGTDAELQMGAVSALSDVPEPQSSAALLTALTHLRGANRELALDAFLRSDDRIRLLLGALKSGQLTPNQLGEKRRDKLRQLPDAGLRQEAAKWMGTSNSL